MSAKSPPADVLQAARRTTTGSAAARRARRDGQVPVNLYGHGEANEHLLVDAHALELALQTERQVFTLSVGGSSEPCLVREVQYDTFGLRVEHVDFTRVDLTEEVEVEVTLEFTGVPKGVTDGGTLIVHHPAIWVRCRADAIPAHIDVDVTAIEMGHAMQAGEIALPSGVVLDEGNMERDVQVVGVVAPRIEEPAAPAEAAVPEGAEAAAEGEAPEGKAAGEPELVEGKGEKKAEKKAEKKDKD